MLFMKDLEDDFKLSFRSTPEIEQSFSDIVSRAQRDKAIRYRDQKKPHRSAVINAIVMWVASRSLDEQRKIVALGMEMLNDHLEAAPADENSGDSPVEPLPVHGKPRLVPSATPKTKKKGSG